MGTIFILGVDNEWIWYIHNLTYINKIMVDAIWFMLFQVSGPKN